ncbi:MAG: hypothetical protein L3V56_05150 [Candidatus Magnetoovum sp. WYHC-5]|nr:hypothetical protein [Candidatus Magnetoovum sp. WYHC-5]
MIVDKYNEALIGLNEKLIKVNRNKIILSQDEIKKYDTVMGSLNSLLPKDIKNIEPKAKMLAFIENIKNYSAITTVNFDNIQKNEKGHELHITIEFKCQNYKELVNFTLFLEAMKFPYFIEEHFDIVLNSKVPCKMSGTLIFPPIEDNQSVQ